MINKILCFMWGHKYQEDARLTALVRFCTLSYFGKYKITAYICKHCGARKHE